MIALSVAALLAIFLLYTAVAGNSTPPLQPSKLAGHAGKVSLTGKVVGPVAGDAHSPAGCGSWLRDITAEPARSRSSTTARCPNVQGRPRRERRAGSSQGGSFVADELTTKCPSKYSDEASAEWLTSAGPRSSSASGWRCTRSSPGRTPRSTTAGGSPTPRATRCSPASARRCSPSVVLAVALVRHDFTFTYVAAHTSRDLPTLYSLSAFWGGQEGSLLLWLLVLTGYGALAVALNRKLLNDLIVWVVPVIGGDRDVLRVHARRGLEPVPDADARARRRRAHAEPPEPVHGRPPADALPRLRRAGDPVRVRGRGAAARGTPTSAGSSRRGAGRSRPGRSSASASCSARTGPTSRSAGAATTPGIRSRTPR